MSREKPFKKSIFPASQKDILSLQEKRFSTFGKVFVILKD